MAVGGYVFAAILVLSWPDRLWWTLHQLLYLLAVVGVTAVSAVVAHRRQQYEIDAALAEQRLAAAFASVGVGLAMTGAREIDDAPVGDGSHDVGDRGTTVIEANPALTSMFGWTDGPPPDALSGLLELVPCGAEPR